MPGPGNYNSAAQFGKGAPTSKIGLKSKEKIDNGIPGPGSYDSNGLKGSKSASTFKFGSGKRGDIVAKTASEQPGPGNYSGFEDKFGNGPKITLGGKPKDLNRN